MTSQDSLLEIIKDSPLSQTTRDFFTKKVQKEGATEENIIALRELLRAVKQQVAQEAGLGISDADRKAAEDKMTAGMTAATEKYTATMKSLEQQANRVAADLQEDLKHLEKIVIKAAQAEA